MPSSFTDKVRRIVSCIPAGTVLNYKAVASLAGSLEASRVVGHAMGSPGETDGWHRVVNAKGQLTSPEPDLQYDLLMKDGARFKRDRVVDMAVSLWDGEGFKPNN